MTNEQIFSWVGMIIILIASIGFTLLAIAFILEQRALLVFRRRFSNASCESHRGTPKRPWAIQRQRSQRDLASKNERVGLTNSRITDEQLNELEDALKTGYDLERYAPLIGDIVKSLQAERRWSVELEKALNRIKDMKFSDEVAEKNKKWSPLGAAAIEARAVLARKQEILEGKDGNRKGLCKE